MVNQLIHKSSIYFHERRKIARLDKAAKEWNCILKHFDKSGDAEAISSCDGQTEKSCLDNGATAAPAAYPFLREIRDAWAFFLKWNTAIGYNAAFVIYFNRTIGGLVE